MVTIKIQHMEGLIMKKREDIRKVNKGNSFYDVFKKRSYKNNREYQLVAGIPKAVFTKRKK